MCGPGSSTEWAKEIDNNVNGEYSNLNQMSDGKSVYYFDNDVSLMYDKDLTFDNQFKNLPLANIRRASFLGGEPMLQSETFEIMSWWAENKKSETIKIQMTTNGTNFTEQWKNLLKQFKNIKIAISTDGVDKTFDYIRTNGNWQKVKENVSELAKIENIKIVFSYTIQMYNVFNFVSILEFLRKWNSEHTHLVDFDEHFAERVQQNYLSTALLNEQDRHSIITELETYASKYPEMNKFTKQIVNVISYDKNRKLTEAEKRYFVDYTNKLDKVRNTNLIKLDSRFKKYLI